MMNFNLFNQSNHDQNSSNPGLLGKLYQYQKTMYTPQKVNSPIRPMEELAAAPQMNRRAAQAVYDFFHGEKKHDKAIEL